MVVTWFHFSPTKSWLHCCPVSRSALTFKLVENTVQKKSCPTLSHATQCRNCRNLDQGNFGMTHCCPALLSRRHVFPWSAVIFDFLAGIIKFSPSANWVPLLIWSKVPFLAKWLLLWSRPSTLSILVRKGPQSTHQPLQNQVWVHMGPSRSHMAPTATFCPPNHLSSEVSPLLCSQSLLAQSQFTIWCRLCWLNMRFMLNIVAICHQWIPVWVSGRFNHMLTS